MDSAKSQPAYARIRNAIAAEIVSGVIHENAQLPTEREMCAQYNVSRITVRHALMLLEQDGLIRKRQGQGIFVCPRRHEQSLDQMYTFSDGLRRHNVAPGYRVLSLELQAASNDIAARLSLPEQAPCFELRRLCMADGKLFAHEQIWIPEPLLRGASIETIERAGLYQTIQAVSGKRPERATESLEAVLASTELAQLLGRKAPLPVMRMTRTAYHRDTAVEHSVRSIVGDKFRFRVNIQ